MTAATTPVDTGPGPGDTTLKARHRAMWASGDYPEIAAHLVADLGPVLVEVAGIQAGERVLDVAAGTGNAALAAAAAGAQVTASDLTPELLEAGRLEAERHGLSLAWEVGDAERLPYDDATFDVTVSCIGAMFAPHHQATADELVRVTRPGGRIALLNWSPAGLVGQMFAAMKPFMPPPPPGAQPPPLWGDEEHLRGLFGDRVADVEVSRRDLEVSLFPGATDLRTYFARNYGPTITAYRNLGDDASRQAQLDQALDDLAARFRRSDGSAPWEYVVFTTTRR